MRMLPHPAHAAKPNAHAAAPSAHAAKPNAHAAAANVHVAKITFLSDRVTLTLPAQCPGTRPNCEWILYVNQPITGAEVGTAMGTTGILSVAYPADFCGVIQADAVVGPIPWRREVGHQRAIQTTAKCSPSSLPGDAGNPAPATTVGATTTNGSGTGPHAALAQLPFTGMDIGPLSTTGIGLVALGLLMLTSLEQQRRARRRLGATVTTLAQWLFRD